MKKQALVYAVVTAMLTMSASAVAADKPPAMEKCYGISKAGKNDCGVPGGNACAAQAKRDGDPRDWILVPKGTCEKIVNGSLKPHSDNKS